LVLATELQHGAISYSHSEDEIDKLVSCIDDYARKYAQ
jgi:hypothetical protein